MNRPSDEELLAQYAQAGGNTRDPGTRVALLALARNAAALHPLALRDATLLPDVLRRPLQRETDRVGFRLALSSAAGADDPDLLRRRLREARHRAVVRIALREILRLADIDQTSREMAWLAEAVIDAAMTAVTRTLHERFGTPIDDEGNEVGLVCLGMGKLGGEELNLGSDIDLCFFYGTDAARLRRHDGTLTDEPTVHELFSRVVRRTSAAIADVTEHGFAFRVDLRLRPEGSRGPLVNSIASAERYYETWGRTWERAALLRARPVGGDLDLGRRLLEVLRPFVHRHEVSPAIAAEMTSLVARARRELQNDEDDVKLGIGGIREAEFFVQSLQLVWGGRYPELRVPGTVDATRRLVGAGLLSDREGRELEADWALLRRVEHRIHVQAGYQTHALPGPGPRREAFARSLGFGDATALETALRAARDRVHALFQSLTGPGESPSAYLADLCALATAGAEPDVLAERIAKAVPDLDPDAAAAHLLRLARRPRSPLGPLSARERPDLGPALLADVLEAADPDASLRHLADFFGRLGGSWGYDRLLDEQPRLRRRLLGLFGASPTVSATLVAHPEALDELLTTGRPPGPERLASLHESLPSDEIETFVAGLRRAKSQATLEIGLAYVGGDLAGPESEALLTELADRQVDAALSFASRTVGRRHGTPRRADGSPAQMVVVGLGKLGAGELGFGGDLDLVFVYDEAGTTDGDRPIDNVEAFARIAQLVLRLLSQPDGEGPGYVTDARLRPGGSQGMLVVSHAGFDRYHRDRAQEWERQALLRARCVAGDPALAVAVEGSCVEHAYGGGAPAPETLAMLRRRMEIELAGEGPGRYHPKLGFGGLVDVEFVVQWLQMRHGDDPRVRARSTRAAIDALVAAGHLPEADAEALREAHRFLRDLEQALRLLDENTEPTLHEGGRVIERVARRLSLRDRDGERATHALVAALRRHCSEVRATFERHVAPVGTRAPWLARAGGPA